MQKAKIWDEHVGLIVLRALSIAIMMVLLLALGRSIVVLREGGFGKLGLYLLGAIIGAMIIALLVVLRRDEIAITIVFAIHIYIDWYLGLHIVSVVTALTLLMVFCLARSSEHPWTEPRTLWLWLAYLGLSLFPAIRGATNAYDAAYYYPNIVFGALILFWLGTVLARDRASIRRCFQALAILGSLLAVHTLFQAATGRVLLGSSASQTFLEAKSFYQLTGSDAHRIGSFFIDPNWNGDFFAIMVFIPLALLVETSSLPAKLLYLVEMSLTLLALLFTYSTGSWIATFAGLLVFVVLVGRASYRVLLLTLIGLAAVAIVLYFPTQIALQLRHASAPAEVSLRVGAWETALRVISAYPLTGVGLGLNAYGLSAEPFRVPAQYVALAHPHDSYLELAAMGGLPVLALFLALLLCNVWFAFRNWLKSDIPTRALLGGGIAIIVTLSVNSISINGWTLPPLAAIGWLILGLISSPLLTKSLVGVSHDESGSYRASTRFIAPSKPTKNTATTISSSS
ncbi:MAG TPA: O-antigen ligase family protein [Ktedonosporobacter sp.]|nr:O-antigen ligase family protein [Ktedonosporobacter sp.]